MQNVEPRRRWKQRNKNAEEDEDEEEAEDVNFENMWNV